MDPVFTIDQMRNYLSLYGDNTTDGMIFRLMEQAISKMEDMNTKALIERQVTDNYRCWNSYFELSQYDLNTVTSVEYIDKDGVTTPYTDYILDKTGKYPRIYFREVPNLELSEYHQNPIIVKYTPIIPANMLYAARDAIQFLVTNAYTHRAMSIRTIDVEPAYKIYKKYRKRIG